MDLSIRSLSFVSCCLSFLAIKDYRLIGEYSLWIGQKWPFI
jgi:hypothetical protein